ncbi:MAG: hypothetical protein FJ147_21110 [Deltaproteobacteria bacterium]|nr:hypothetical protein [Deltaproteobacteria bacterium]
MSHGPSSLDTANVLGTPADVFVGRAREMEWLQSCFHEATAGNGRIALLVGEAGIGKTRVANEFATYARSRNASVLIGQCSESEGTPPFWPWVQIVRATLPPHQRTSSASAHGGERATEIVRILPELHKHFPPHPAEVHPFSEDARGPFFDSFTEMLTQSAMARPVVLILDDLQWADASSLLLLQWVARALPRVPVFLLGTYREAGIEADHPLSATLAELARVPHSQRIPLAGLSQSDVSALVEAYVGTPLARSGVTAVYQQTEGNPFFIHEMVQTLLEDGTFTEQTDVVLTPLPLPQRVREVLRVQFRRLSKNCMRSLTLASVIGREFHLKVLQMLLRQATPPLALSALRHTLDEAIVAGVLDTVPHHLGLFRFSHPLMRETFYESLPPVQRRHVHGQVGAIIEHQVRADTTPHLAALAHHFLAAAHVGTQVRKAIAYAQQAGERAMAVYAYEAAVNYYQQALQAVDLQSRHTMLRGELLLAMGEAQQRAGEPERARVTLQQAALQARQQYSRNPRAAASLLARVAIGMPSGFTGTAAGSVDPAVVSLLQDALKLLPQRAIALRAQVLARLAIELYWAQDHDQRHALSAQAVTLARRGKDAAILVRALHARYIALWGPEYLDDRLAVTAELVSIAEATGDRELIVRSLVWRIVDLLEVGDIDQVDRELIRYTTHAEVLRQPLYLWFLGLWRALRAGLVGHLSEAEQLAQQAYAIGQRVRPTDAQQCLIAQILSFRNGRERIDLEAPTLDLAQQFTAIPAWRCVLTVLYADRGRVEDARRELDFLAQNEFAVIPKNTDWLIALGMLADACATLGDQPHAAALYQLLLPYAGRCIVVGPGAVQQGSVARSLGLLAATLGQWDAAQAHFAAALQMNTHLGARPLVALTQCEYARMLLDWGQQEGQPRALALLDEAARMAEELEMHDLIDKIVRQQQRVSSSDPLTPSETVQNSAQATAAVTSSSVHRDASFLRQEGEFWSFGYQGTVCRVKNTRGVRFLAQLLSHPSQEFLALELVTVRSGKDHVPLVEGDSSLDETAKVNYRQRLRELQGELGEAEQHHDLGRVTLLRREQELLSQELGRAVGLYHRDRQSNSPIERARINVTRAIKEVISKIHPHHPSLADHLRHTIKTGTFCAYVPDPRVPITWAR